jgi:hypothetical protein
VSHLADILATQAVAATMRRHPSIFIIPLLLFLAMTTGGIIGVIFVAQNENHQRRMSAEGAHAQTWHSTR